MTYILIVITNALKYFADGGEFHILKQRSFLHKTYLITKTFVNERRNDLIASHFPHLFLVSESKILLLKYQIHQ